LRQGSRELGVSVPWFLCCFVEAMKGRICMKRKDRFFLQLSRKLFHDPEFQKLSINAKWLYVVLNELEHRFSGNKEDFFFRSNNDLAKDAGFSLPTLKRAKKELIESGLVQVSFMHWVDSETGKRSKKHITAYQILE
jgi:hypothetical protein